jgi:hypothetical protein
MRCARQLVATHGNGFACFGGSLRLSICDQSPRVATTGLFLKKGRLSSAAPAAVLFRARFLVYLL